MKTFRTAEEARPASSAPPSDAEMIERVKRAERMRVEVGTQHGPWFTEALGLAICLQSALTRISSLERELGASDAALIDIHGLMEREFGPPEWAPDHPTAQAIEAARRRSAT